MAERFLPIYKKQALLQHSYLELKGRYRPDIKFVQIFQEVLFLLNLPDAKSLFPEHVAECAFIMGTAQGCLYQHTVGLYPGPVYFSLVLHNIPLCHIPIIFRIKTSANKKKES